MSRANVEVVRAATEAMVAGDVETALGHLAPDVEWHGTVGGLDEGSVAHGLDEVVEGFLAYFETWERIELRADRYVDAPGDDVVVFFHEVARGRESGAVVETDTGTVNTVRDGKIVRVRAFMDRGDALRAAGLSGSNVDLARSIWTGWERGDFRAVEWAQPDIEFVPGDLPDADVHVGIPAMNAAWREFLRSWDDFRIHADEYRELDRERVLVLATFTGRGKQSGVDVGRAEMKGALVFHMVDGKVKRMVFYYNRDRGLAELGL